MVSKDLVGKVALYLSRAKNYSEQTPLYPLEQVGTFEIIGGSHIQNLDWENRFYRPRSSKLFHGRFIDAIALAVQQPSFYAEGRKKFPNDINAGYIEMIEKERVRKLKPIKGLVELVKKCEIKKGYGYHLDERGNLTRFKTYLHK